MTNRTLRFITTMMATITWIVPVNVMGEVPTPPDRSSDLVTPLDVEVTPEGWLTGTTVDPNGAVRAEVPVQLLDSRGVAIETTTSDQQGQFKLRLDRGGTYELVSGENRTWLRCWAAETAPPGAAQSAMLRVGPIERGQVHPGVSSFANPWVITGIVAAAIIIPIAIHNNRDDRNSASN